MSELKTYVVYWATVAVKQGFVIVHKAVFKSKSPEGKRKQRVQTIEKRIPITIDIPFKMVEKEKHGYDYGAWSVSDRDFTYTETVKEYDAKVIEKLSDDALNGYCTYPQLYELTNA